MHISCPNCSQIQNVKNYNLFSIRFCKRCKWHFRGVHADKPCGLNFLYEFALPMYHGPHINDISDCPYCGTMIELNWIYSTSAPRPFGPYANKGYNGPYVCKGCTEDLPWEYPSQYKVAQDSYFKQHGFPSHCETQDGMSGYETWESSVSDKHTIEEKVERAFEGLGKKLQKWLGNS